MLYLKKSIRTLLAILVLTLLFLLLGLLGSCRSKKITQESLTSSVVASVDVDSSDVRASASALLVSEDLRKSLNLDFDTLEVEIRRPPMSAADIPETVRVRAIRGTLSTQHSDHRDSLAVAQSLDSVAYRANASKVIAREVTTKSEKKPTTTPTYFLCAVIILLLIILFLWIKQRLN